MRKIWEVAEPSPKATASQCLNFPPVKSSRYHRIANLRLAEEVFAWRKSNVDPDVGWGKPFLLHQTPGLSLLPSLSKQSFKLMGPEAPLWSPVLKIPALCWGPACFDHHYAVLLPNSSLHWWGCQSICSMVGIRHAWWAACSALQELLRRDSWDVRVQVTPERTDLNVSPGETLPPLMPSSLVCRWCNDLLHPVSSYRYHLSTHSLGGPGELGYKHSCLCSVEIQQVCVSVSRSWDGLSPKLFLLPLWPSPKGNFCITFLHLLLPPPCSRKCLAPKEMASGFTRYNHLLPTANPHQGEKAHFIAPLGNFGERRHKQNDLPTHWRLLITES